MNPPLLAVWQFTSAAMLFWAFAAVAPLLIHLLTRRTYRRTSWAAMEWLLRAAEKKRRRIQIEQWLLLAVRTLILLLFALALADPIVANLAQLSASGKMPTHRIFVLDASYSMDSRVNGQSRFQAAKERIRELVSQASQGDGFSLLYAAEPPRVTIGEPAFAPDDLLNELDALPLSNGSSDIPAAMMEVEGVMKRMAELFPRLRETHVYLISDGERTSWQSATSSDSQQRWSRWAEAARLHFVDVGVDGLDNAAVVQLELRDAPAVVDREMKIESQIANFSKNGPRKTPVTFTVDGEVMERRTIELPATGKIDVAFTHRFQSPGEHMVTVRLDDDALPVDNVRYLAVPVRRSLRVACVYARPGETKLLAIALEPEQRSIAGVQVEEIPETSLYDGDLSKFDAIFLVNLPGLTGSDVATLADYVRGGGGLAIFLGDQADPQDYVLDKTNAALRDLLPATFDKVAPTGDYRFTPRDYRHELIAPFRGHERSGLLTVPIWKYGKLQPAVREDVSIALAFDNGDPAIVTGRFGAGKVVLFATAASPNAVDTSSDPPTPWTALPTWPSFPPLIQETLLFLARGGDERRNVNVGDSLHGEIQTASSDWFVEITAPVVEQIGEMKGSQRAAVVSEQGRRVWSFADTSLAGIYEARLPSGESEKFAVRLEPNESELERIDPASLPAGLLREQEEQVTSSGGTASDKRPWFRELLIVVFALLIAESFLARWFGGGRA